jgi:putative ABC transport system ATP-binding protein
MQPLIQIQGLEKTYGTGPAAVRALEGIDLEVYPGEVLMLLGPSGSGKTTLLSIMGAILEASQGSVKIRGREIVGLRESELPRVRLQNIGFIFQGFNLFPALTARENVELALQLRNASAALGRRRATELLERMGMGERMHAHPADLSGGQKQRVAIARALAGDPPIVLADEPTASLDSHTGRIVAELLSELARREGRAVVVVTHDPRMLDYGTRTIRIADGRIQSEKAQEVRA